MLHIQNISKIYQAKKMPIHAVNDVTFTISESEVVALIGESGSGKSTIAELIVGLQSSSEGTLLWGEEPLNLKHREHIQYIFQNPDRSLNPLWSIEDILLEPLTINKVPIAKARKIIHEQLELVDIPMRLLKCTTKECSGGQKQRIAIARTLSMQPRLLIADEITASLDPKTEEKIIQLLKVIKEETKLSILYITHRLHTIENFANNMIVLKEGEIVERGKVKELLLNPTSAYTKKLIQACYYDNFLTAKEYECV